MRVDVVDVTQNSTNSRRTSSEKYFQRNEMAQHKAEWVWHEYGFLGIRRRWLFFGLTQLYNTYGPVTIIIQWEK